MARAGFGAGDRGRRSDDHPSREHAWDPEATGDAG